MTSFEQFKIWFGRFAIGSKASAAGAIAAITVLPSTEAMQFQAVQLYRQGFYKVDDTTYRISDGIIQLLNEGKPINGEVSSNV